MWKYNELGIHGKLQCKKIMTDISKTETDINNVVSQMSVVNSKLTECQSNK